MHCYFSASHSQPPILLTYLYLAVLQTLLKKLRELSLSQTPVFFFVIDRCWLNFILHVLLFFSQLQPPPNPSDSLIPASDYSEEPKWVMFACILFYVAIITFNNFGHVPFFQWQGRFWVRGIFWRNYITSKTMLSLQIYWTIIDRFAKAFQV